MERIQSLEEPDIPRLIEDLAATLPLYTERQAAGRTVLPSAAMLATLGQSYLSAQARGEVFPFLDNPGFRALVAAWIWPTGVGEVRLSCFLAGIVLARRDVWTSFQIAGSSTSDINWPRCLQWLIMHGLGELSLSKFTSRAFLHVLQSESLTANSRSLTPLDLLLIREYPEWSVKAPTNTKRDSKERLQRWIESRGENDVTILFGRPAVRTEVDQWRRKIKMAR